MFASFLLLLGNLVKSWRKAMYPLFMMLAEHPGPCEQFRLGSKSAGTKKFSLRQYHQWQYLIQVPSLRRWHPTGTSYRWRWEWLARCCVVALSLLLHSSSSVGFSLQTSLLCPPLFFWYLPMIKINMCFPHSAILQQVLSFIVKLNELPLFQNEENHNVQNFDFF